MVVSPFNKKQSLLLVPTVGLILVARRPEPLIVTPCGTVIGKTSVNVPGARCTVSPALTCVSAYFNVAKAL